MRVKETGIINQFIVDVGEIHTLQEMYDAQKEVKRRINNYPKALQLLKEVNDKFDEGYDLKDFDWRNLDDIREFLKENE